MEEHPSKDIHSATEIANPITNDSLEISYILWSISVCQSYPTHFIQLLFIKDEKMKENGITKNHQCYDSCVIPPYLSTIAFHSIFPNPARALTTAKSNIKQEQKKSFSFNSESEKNTIPCSSLTYGEILPESIIETIHWIKSNKNISVFRHNFGGKVIDLGSGNGKVLFASCTNHIFSDAYGVEISYDWHMEALHHLSTWKRNHAFYDEQNIHSDLTTCTKFHFVNDDILSQNTNNLLIDVDVIIIHGTLFDDDLFHAIEKNIQRYCTIGTIVISITKPLGYLDTLSVQNKRMNWGSTNVFIQQKI